MSEAARWGVVLAICLYVVLIAWMSRRIALDMDAKGFEGWIYGLATFIAAPVGLAAWALDRKGAPGPRGMGKGGLAVIVVALIVTFPWGLLLLLLMRARTTHV